MTHFMSLSDTDLMAELSKKEEPMSTEPLSVEEKRLELQQACQLVKDGDARLKDAGARLKDADASLKVSEARLKYYAALQKDYDALEKKLKKVSFHFGEMKRLAN